MLYLFCGDDANKKRESCEKFIRSLPKGTEIFFINRNNFDPAALSNFYSGSGLFFSACAVVFSDILEREDNRDFILQKIAPLAASSTTFIFSEGKLGKPVLDIFKKHGGQIVEYLLPKQKKEKFNNFLLADAFASKNKLNLWVNFRLAVEKGVGLEELVGVMFWKIKDLLLKRNFSKFSERELQHSASRLSYLLPQARKKGQDAETSLEQFLLEAF